MWFVRTRKSRTSLLDRDLSEAGSRAIETIGDIAEQALAVAKDAGQAATPVLQQSAETLSKALEKAAEAISETGDRLGKIGEQRAGEAAHVARTRLADASEKLAGSIRPRKRSHRVRNLLIAAAVVGGVVALVQSPLRAKVSEKLFGPPLDQEPESIQLPGSEALASGTLDTEEPPATETSTSQETAQAVAEHSVEGNGVPSAQAGLESQA